MYEVKETSQKFDSFLAAVAVAKNCGSDVFEVATGIRRWTPAPKVCAKRSRQYAEQCAAYAAQQAAK